MIVGFGIGFDKMYRDQDGFWIASRFLDILQIFQKKN